MTELKIYIYHYWREDYKLDDTDFVIVSDSFEDALKKIKTSKNYFLFKKSKKEMAKLKDISNWEVLDVDYVYSSRVILD